RSFLLSHAAADVEPYTLSLHDALPISSRIVSVCLNWVARAKNASTIVIRATDVVAAPDVNRARTKTTIAPPSSQSSGEKARRFPDRKSTRLNSSHVAISYAVFCLKKKK